MDIDISDILADVSKPSQRPGFDGISAATGVFDYDAITAATDHQLLVRAWTSERCVPDLLPYPRDLMDRIIARVRAQITRIEDLTGGMGDPNFAAAAAGQTGGGGALPSKPSNQNANLVLSVLQTDLSRTQFLVRSYLRQRLAKITKHAVFYLTKHVDQDTKEDSDLLSPAEVQFLRNHQALLSEFYDSTFLNGFPASLRRLDDGSGGVSMVEGPDGGGGVVVRCLSETWTNDQLLGDGDDAPTVELRMKRGEVWVVRWRDVKSGVIKGDLEAL